MGYIYKILCNITGECYYGHSKGGYSRINCHTAKSNNTSSKPIIDRGNFQYIIIENNIDDNMLNEREYYYITNNQCVNKTIPFVENDNKTHRHRKEEKYRYYSNPEFYKKKSNNYYHNNKEKIKEYRSAKTVCECGMEIPNANKARHLKSQFHLDNI